MHSKVILKRYGSVKLVLLFRTVTSLRETATSQLSQGSRREGFAAHEMLTMLILAPLWSP